MTRDYRYTCLALALNILVAGVASAASVQDNFEQLLGDYEGIRMALLQDTMEGVEGHAKSLGGHAESLLRHPASHEHESPEADVDKYTMALGTIVEVASGLASAKDLSSARSAMFELTKPMVQIRGLAGDETTLVAYCSMAGKSWLQEEGDLGNPYQGQEMPTCGEVVSR